MILGEAIREARSRSHVGLRELSRRSGVSAGQISRIETGVVEQPSIATIVSLSRALELNPQPLLIAAGHIDLAIGRRLLADLLRPHRGEKYNPEHDSEVTEEWIYSGWDEELAAARAVLADVNSAPQTVRSVAARVFCTYNAEETEWSVENLNLLGADGDRSELDELLQAWRDLPLDLRFKVLDYARDQVVVHRADAARSTSNG